MKPIPKISPSLSFPLSLLLLLAVSCIPHYAVAEMDMLSGYATRGSTLLTFKFWANGTSKEAIALAKQIFAQFEKLDTAALYALPLTE
jgi:hypothetical protein